MKRSLLKTALAVATLCFAGLSGAQQRAMNPAERMQITAIRPMPARDRDFNVRFRIAGTIGLSAEAKELAYQKCLKPGTVLHTRRQHDDPAKPVRLPVEVALIVLADQFDHFALHGNFDIALWTGIDFNDFLPVAARTGRPAAKGKLAGAMTLLQDLEYATGTTLAGKRLQIAFQVGGRDVAAGGILAGAHFRIELM